MSDGTEGGPTKSATPRLGFSAWRIGPPRLCSNHVPRPRLFELLDRGFEGGLTLVVAPAGFGKTTLVAAWAATAARPVAWATLTRVDGDLPAFVRLLVAALQSVAPDAGSSLLSLLLMQELPATDVFASMIASELADLPDALTLVLDDCESIEDTAAQTLLGELLRILPNDVQIVLASRRAPRVPFGLLRGRGRLTEIGPRELRFRPDEVETFLGTATDLKLPPMTVGIVGERTEGWPVCLSLVRLVLEEQADPAAWVETFHTGSHRYVEELLLDEVLALQTPEVQEVLLRTSIVDEVCAELVDALLPEKAPRVESQALLDELVRRQRLFDSIDEGRRWYRCHALLRDALRYRLRGVLTREEIADLHRRAADWFTAEGLIDEALEQALAGNDPSSAVQIVEQSVGVALIQGDFLAIERRLERLHPEQVATRPRLLLARAWCLAYRSRYDAMMSTLSQLEAVLDRNDAGLSPGDLEIFRAEAAAARAEVAMLAGDGPLVMELAHRAHEYGPQLLDFSRVMAQIMVGIGHHLLGETDAGIRFLEAANQEAPYGVVHQRLGAFWGQAFVHLPAARPLAAWHSAQQLLAVSPVDQPVRIAWAHYFCGLASYELNRLDEARDHFLAIDQRRHAAHRACLLHALLRLARIEHLHGDSDAAWMTLKSLEALPDIASNERNLAVVRIFAAQLAFEMGDLEAARDWLRASGAFPLFQTLETPSGSPTLTRVRLLINLGDADELAPASSTLDALEAAAASINDSVQWIGVQAVRALLCQARGDIKGALQFAGQAVARAAPGGLVRTFVDLGSPMQRLLTELARRSPTLDPYLARLVSSFPTTSAPLEPPTPSRRGAQIGPGLIESLTRREMEILQLLEARYSNKEIAEALLISSETVKRHTSNIYQKLMVATRREAVAQAYAHGLLNVAEPLARLPHDVRTA